MKNNSLVLIVAAVVVIAAIAGAAILMNGNGGDDEGASEITYSEPGTYSQVGEYDKVTISSPGVTIEGATVGKLVITEDVGEGDVYIVDSVIDSMEVYGGGTNSVHIKGNTTVLDSILKKATGDIRLVTDDNAKVSKVTVWNGPLCLHSQLPCPNRTTQIPSSFP